MMNVGSEHFHVSEATRTVWEAVAVVAEQEVLTEPCWTCEGFFSVSINAIVTKTAGCLL